MDTEGQRLAGQLRRLSRPGSVGARAARYIDGMGGAPQAPNARAAEGLIDMRDAVDVAARTRGPPEPAPDHAVRDMLTKEALGILGDERARQVASEEVTGDRKYVQWLREIANGRYKHIAKLIALTARFAGELTHDLISPHAREHIEARLEQGGYAGYAVNLAEVESAVDDLVDGSDAWTALVDCGLAGNARMACHEISQKLERMRGLTMTHVLETARTARNEHDHIFIDFFCAVIAARWRANSVFAAQPYKTGNEQEAVTRALADASARFCDFAIKGRIVAWSPRHHPRTLAELRFGPNPMAE